MIGGASGGNFAGAGAAMIPFSMRRCLMMVSLTIAAVSAAALDPPELPVQDENVSSDIEPPLLPQNTVLDDSALDPKNTPTIEAELARARKRAASADRLFRAGIIARVEAEERALRVVQLEALLAEAQLEDAKKVAAETHQPNDTIVAAEERARSARERCRRAEIEAAERNLERQKKLLALGSARKSDVNRAEEKLAKLQRPAN